MRKTVESQTEEVENVTQAQPDESVEVKTSESANQEESQFRGDSVNRSNRNRAK